MQWKLPPPVSTWSARNPIATRPGKQRLDDVHGGPIVRRAILRHNHGGIADVEVHVARRDDVAVLILDAAGRGEGDDIELGSLQSFGGVAIDGVVGIVLRGGRDCDAAGRDEAREIVDVAVGVVVEQALAEPDHALEAEVVLRAAARSLHGSRGVAVRVQQALLGGQDGAGTVSVDRAALEHPIGLGIGQ